MIIRAGDSFKAEDILEKTNDGDDLSAGDLDLVQNAVNHNLTDQGHEAFIKLHTEVMKKKKANQMIIIDFETKYVAKQTIFIKTDRYADTGNVALKVVGQGNEPMMTATVNPPDPITMKSMKLEAGTVALKDYSENQGVVAAFIKAEVIERQAVKIIPLKHSNVGVYRLTDKAKKELGL